MQLPKKYWVWGSVFLLLVSACGAAPPPNNDDPGEPLVFPEETEEGPSVEATLDTRVWVRGNAVIKRSSLVILESYPIQVVLMVKGELPTPCNVFRTNVAQPNADNEIHIETYSESEEGVTCVQVIQEFEESVSIPMMDAPDGTYTVWVGRDKVGEFKYPGGG